VIQFVHRRRHGGGRHREAREERSPQTHGTVIAWAWRYDLLVGLLTLGRERALRRMTADLARLQPGEAVLEVGCGTGSLALVAKRRVGEAGRVAGIDPAPQMIARAMGKATRHGLSIDFEVGVIERLPYPDRSFDVVLSSLMMHHLPDYLKREGLAEVARVLKPGGRLLVLDAVPPSGYRHDGGIEDQPALMRDAGFVQIETGRVTFPPLGALGYARGRTSEAGA
jgi:ubiquinone/menaquinone biosynthesis C-methylase UbiE